MSKAKNERSTALITGGSRGIGLALAREFARGGHDLVLVARDPKALEEAAAALQAETGVAVSTYALDLSQRDAASDVFRRVAAAGVRVDVLVNNAGLGDHGAFVESDLERQSSMLDLNIRSLTALTRLFLEPMVARGRGRILNVASVVAYFAGGPGWATYVASKAYVLSFTRGLAAELRGTGVTVTALSPGTTGTDFVDRAGVASTRVYRWLPKASPERVARAGYRGVMRGRTSVVPGIFTKVLAFLGELHPRSVAQGVFAFLSRAA